MGIGKKVTESTTYQESLEKLSSRWVVTSSVVGNVMDGRPGEGSPFANSIVRILLKNAKPQISVAEFFQQVRAEMNNSYPSIEMIPGLGILRNSEHEGGEFCFKLKEEFVQLENEPIKIEDLIEKSLRDSMEKLKKEFLDKVEHTPRDLEEKIKIEAPKQVEVNKKKLLKLLSNDQVDAYFEEVDRIQELELVENDILIEVLNLQAQWRSIENQSRIDIVTKEVEYQTKNKIRKGLIEVTNKFKFNKEP